MLILPALLVLLFECLKGQKALMDGWVSGFMAPVEQFLGRVWSLLPWFSVAEVLTALFLVGSAAWFIRAVVLLVRERAGGRFLRRLLAFGSALLWLWAAVSWMWNAAYYASSFQGRSGLKAEPYSVETLAQVTALFAQKAAEFSTQVERDESSGRFLLKKALHPEKDQSYVLWSLTQAQLARVRLPLGRLSKEEIRSIAQEQGLVSARKRDSQDICFVPDGDYAAFLRHHTGREYPSGPFLDASGNVLGTHQGIIHYTVGQRRGLGVSSSQGRLYVQQVRPEDTPWCWGTTPPCSAEPSPPGS